MVRQASTGVRPPWVTRRGPCPVGRVRWVVSGGPRAEERASAAGAGRRSSSTVPPATAAGASGIPSPTVKRPTELPVPRGLCDRPGPRGGGGVGDHRAWCHIPNTELAVRALDGGRAAWSASAARHLSRCRACRDRLTAYERVVRAGRLTQPGQTLQEPPPGVWAAVRSGIATDDLRTPPPGRSRVRGTPPSDRPRPRAVCRAGERVLRCAAAVVRAVLRLLAPLARLLPGTPRGPHD